MPIYDWGFSNDGSSVTTALMLFPFMDNGNLRSFIDKNTLTGFIAQQTVLKMFVGLCYGVRELHSHNPQISHRDIKPENVMLSQSNEPVLMDFGSMGNACKEIKNRSEALLLQDEASQFSTMSYRAPELFDVPSSAYIDTRTDIWSLGCVLYALAFGYSPFECEFLGESNKPTVVECSFLRVIGPLSFPRNDKKYSPEFVKIIKWILNVDTGKRPFIGQVIERIESLMAKKRNVFSIDQV
mmetsp:Transcript_1105/g.1680  ORF Transcript_1105/g.1680 Transcript_1105/m.1680 type:complete len:240 (+) Transcript_1105:322-1041(+)